MKKRIVAMLLVLVMLVGYVPSAAQATEITADTGNPVMQTFYVSPDGDDANAGTESAPFATLEKAKAAVDAINDAMYGDIVVYLMDGVWELEDTLSFGQSDSGTNGYYVRYEAAPGASPMISGGTKLANSWTDEDGDGIYSIPLDRDVKLRALYVNGQRRYMAHTEEPVYSYYAWDTYTVTKGQEDWAWASGSESNTFCYYISNVPEITRNVQDVEIENQFVWNKNTVCVDKIVKGGDGKGWVFYLQQPYGAIAQTPGWNVNFGTHSPHVIHNAYELLNKPGEFYFDREADTLYYIPVDGEDMGNAEVVVPRLETVVEFHGDPQVTGEMNKAGADNKTITGQVKNIIFDGITVAHSDWNLQKVGNSYGKATVQAGTVLTAYASGNWHADMYRNLDTLPGAVEMEFAHNICFQNGEVKLTGAEGIVLSNDVDGCQVIGNFIYETGGGGVLVGHPHHVYENDSLEPETYYYHYSYGDGKPEIWADGAVAEHEKYQNGTERAPRDVKVSNNFLLENCRLFPSHCPITSYFTQRLEVSNNFIKDAAYSGMSIGWGWGNFDGETNGNRWGTENDQGYAIIPGIPTEVCRDNQIINNRIDTTMTILDDGGLIYTLGKQDGTLISGNYGRDSEQGLYQDEGSANFETICDNVMADVRSYALTAMPYGRKHDLHYDNNYSNKNTTIFAPQYKVTGENFHYIADSMWPKEASDIIQNSGLTAEYRARFSDQLVEAYGSVQDALMPQKAWFYTGEQLTLNAWLDADDEIWLAPAGTTKFDEGVTMTKAAGNAASMEVPSQPGTYYLYAVIDGEATAASASYINVREGIKTIGTGTVEAEDCAFQGQTTTTYNDSAASGGAGVENLYYVGDSITIGKLSERVDELTITYASQASGTFGLYVNNQKTQDIPIVSNGAWNGTYTTAKVYFSPALQAGDVLSLKVNYQGQCWNLDKFELSYSENAMFDNPYEQIRFDSIYASNHFAVVSDAANGNHPQIDAGVGSLGWLGDGACVAVKSFDFGEDLPEKLQLRVEMSRDMAKQDGENHFAIYAIPSNQEVTDAGNLSEEYKIAEQEILSPSQDNTAYFVQTFDVDPDSMSSARSLYILCGSGGFNLKSVQFYVPMDPMEADKENALIYTEPASDFNEALPMGNGFIGAMVYGGVDTERIGLNEGTIWTGSPYENNVEGASGSLEDLREQTFSGSNVSWTNSFIDGKFMDSSAYGPSFTGSQKYQLAGELNLTTDHKATAYVRYLDLDTATAVTQYRWNDSLVTREYFVSNPDRVMAMRLSSDNEPMTFTGSYDLKGMVERGRSTEGNDTLVIQGGVNDYRTVDSGIEFTVRVKFIPKNGTARADGNAIVVSDTTDCTVLVTIATNFVSYDDISGDEDALAKEMMDKASAKTYEQLREAHIADYQELYNRVELDLGGSSTDAPVEEVRQRLAGSDDPTFIELAYNFDRYLQIACSREGSQPSNLQGIWNDELNPMWDCNYTTNINLQMNYWPALPTNLEECYAPMIEKLKSLQAQGHITAEELYGITTEGAWTLHHNTDLWSITGPVAGDWGMTPTCGAWLSNEAYRVYQYNQDREYLEEIYPIIKGAAQFLLEFLVEDENGQLNFCPSSSPEIANKQTDQFASVNSAFDIQVTNELFRNVIEAAELLDEDTELAAELEIALDKLPPVVGVGSWGQVQEFYGYDGDIETDNHRHISHLYGVFPGTSITEENEEYWNAAYTTLKARSAMVSNETLTGWSIAWRIAQFACFGDAEQAYAFVKTMYDMSYDYCLPNLFTVCPPFQYDANGGMLAAVTTMLVVDQNGAELLKGLPEQWQNGSVKGLRLKGNFTLDEMTWQNGELTSVTVTSHSGQPLQLSYGEKTVEMETVTNETYVFDGDLQLEKAAADQAAAAEVEALINDLPAAEAVTLNDKNAIEEAEEAYAELTPDQKNLVKNYGDLTAARAAYDALKAAADKLAADKAAAAGVDAKIEEIGEVELTDEEAISNARAAYDALTDAQKALVQNLSVLEAAEVKLAELKQEAADAAAAADVDSKIAALGEITLNSEEAIQKARAAYEELTDAQKGKVTKLDVLEAAEATLAQLKKEAADKAAADAVKAKIEAIGEVTLESLADIVDAETAYAALTDAQKALVTNHEDLIEARETYNELKAAADKLAADKAAAKGVDAKIEEIGEVTLESKDAIEAARNAYTALKDDQEQWVTKLDVLEKAEARLADLQAADAVDTLIDLIGDVTLEDKAAIEAAEKAYNYLTKAQQAEVQNYAKLLAARAEYNRLKAAVDKLAADKAAAKGVDDLIDSIGEVDLDSKDRIEAVRAAYEALTADEKAHVTKLSVLEAAEAEYARLKEQRDLLISMIIAGASNPKMPFTDVTKADWFYDEVNGAWQAGLINGMTETTFEPNSSLTVAQAIKLAAALHQRNEKGRVTLKNGDTAWYSSYVEYAVRNKIIGAEYLTYSDGKMNSAVSRAEFVHILHGAMSYYKWVNNVADNAIPDVKTGSAYASEIYAFYRAGILTGSDAAGTFYPASSIKRSEVAAILVRMYDKDARQAVTLK